MVPRGGQPVRSGRSQGVRVAQPRRRMDANAAPPGLARGLQHGSKEAEHRKALDLPDLQVVQTPNLLSGYNPPWVRMALAEVPPESCGLLLGEIPGEWRKLLTEELGLRICPRTFVWH